MSCIICDHEHGAVSGLCKATKCACKGLNWTKLSAFLDAAHEMRQMKVGDALWRRFDAAYDAFTDPPEATP